MNTASARHMNRTAFVNRFNGIVGAAVREKREEAKLSLSVLAAACGVAKSTIEQVEEGRAISLPTLAIIAHELDCTLDDLVTIDASNVLLMGANRDV